MTEWRDISSAPDEPHIRGMWVFGADDRRPLYFCVNAGYVDDDGAFVSMDGADDFGWSADDYDWWAPLPLPVPEPPA